MAVKKSEYGMKSSKLTSPQQEALDVLKHKFGRKWFEPPLELHRSAFTCGILYRKGFLERKADPGVLSDSVIVKYRIKSTVKKVK